MVSKTMNTSRKSHEKRKTLMFKYNHKYYENRFFICVDYKDEHLFDKMYHSSTQCVIFRSISSKICTLNFSIVIPESDMIYCKAVSIMVHSQTPHSNGNFQFHFLSLAYVKFFITIIYNTEAFDNRMTYIAQHCNCDG